MLASGVWTQWDRGTGRRSSMMTSTPWGRISSIQAPSSSTFAMVADSAMTRALGGMKIRLSSQTVPRSRSSR